MTDIAVAADDHQPADENQIMAERRAKLAAIRRQQPSAFPNDAHPTHRAAPLHARYEGHSRETLEAERVEVRVAGRVMLKRVQGKASFMTIQDATERIQLWFNDEGLGAEQHEVAKHWDLGDIIEAHGVLFKT
ncbi:MAG: lysine--tRNA ligase, partial [Betaproteobacteria bacterium]|nr:lysine--tRNA ligase [Betaproteobacteria bacterium]